MKSVYQQGLDGTSLSDPELSLCRHLNLHTHPSITLFPHPVVSWPTMRQTPFRAAPTPKEWRLEVW